MLFKSFLNGTALMTLAVFAMGCSGFKSQTEESVEESVAASKSAPAVSSSTPTPTPAPAAQTLILVSDRFWDVANAKYPSNFVEKVKASLSGMPSGLKSTSLSAANRALQLQWAFKVANESPAANVEIWVQPGDYDFSKIMTAHVSVPSGQAARYLPKLYIGRDRFRVVANQSAKPRFFSAGPGADGVNHGRVLLMVSSGLKGVKIERIDFQGDHSLAQLKNADYIAHENNGGLVSTESAGTYSYGLMMIGYKGGENDVTVDGCGFTGINYTGISLVGNATIQNSSFKGIMGELGGDFDAYYGEEVAAYDVANARMGFVGMAIGNGLRLMSAYGSLKVLNSDFRNLVEGIVGVGIGAGSRIEKNTFSVFSDHAIYLLGAKMPKSSISFNKFDKTLGSALKLSGWADDYGHPLDGSASFSNLTVQGNEFRNARRTSIEMSGTFNTIRDNVVYAYDGSGDASGGYNPWPQPGSGFNIPDFWFSSLSGGVQFWNHFAFNRIENNRVDGNKRLLEIFVHHDLKVYGVLYPLSGANDRSLGFNYFDGAWQHVSYRQQLGSWSAPLLIMNSSQLTLSPPQDCAGCDPDVAGYRKDITIQWAAKVRAGSSTAYLVKYTEGVDIYLISSDGIHERVNPQGRVFDVLAVADLDGDGYDEVYSREAGDTKLYGSRVYRPGFLAAGSLDQWIFGDPGSALLGWSVTMGGAGKPGKFYAVFAHAANRVYMSTPRSDGAVHVLGDIYTYSGGVQSLPATSGSWGVTSSQFMSAAKDIFLNIFAQYTR